MCCKSFAGIYAIVLLSASPVWATEKSSLTPAHPSAVLSVSATDNQTAVEEDGGASPDQAIARPKQRVFNPLTERTAVTAWPSQESASESSTPASPFTEEAVGRCVLDCEPNEGEPNCYDGYDDTYNSGCLYWPGNFLPLQIGDTICGTSGTYVPAGWPFTQPALDYYSITVTEDTELTITIYAEFIANAGLSAPHPSLFCEGPKQRIELLEWLTPCEEATITRCVPPGTYWFGINPTFGHSIPCDVKYELAVTGQPCQADVPENDTCDNATEVSIPSTTVGDLLFAQPDELPDCMIDQSGVGVWYEVTGTGNKITASTCSPNVASNTRVSVYCGSCDGLFCVAGNEWDKECPFQGSAVSWCSVPNEKYYIRLTGNSSDTQYEFTVTDDGQSCTTPASCAPVSTDCRPGDIPEWEPVCQDEYVDTYNGGCDGVPSVFQSTAFDETVCGTSGVYWRDSQPIPETDWYEVVVTEDTLLTWAVQAEFHADVVLWDGTSGCDSKIEIDRASSAPYQYAMVSACVPPGTYWLALRPSPAAGITPCGVTYRVTATRSSCTIPTGACCLLDGDCLIVPQNACTTDYQGIYHGDGVSCDDVSCPIYAAADTCFEAVEVTVPSSTLGTTLMATYDNVRMCNDLPPGQGVWFKVTGTGTALAATAYATDTGFAPQIKVYCAGCEVTRCVGADDSGCPFDGPQAFPNTVNWCSEAGVEYLIYVSECIDKGDFWLDVTEGATPCTNPPACEACTPDFVITAPGAWAGTTCGALDDCVDIGNGTYEDHVYELTIPYDGTWVISLCGSSYSTVLGLGTRCCSTDIALIQPTQIPCMQPEFTGFLEAGTYFVSIEGGGWFPMCGDYTLRVFEEGLTCSLECPAGATNEQEACGLQTNEGCELSSPAFETISNGQTVCGTFWSDAFSFGNDWYEIVLDERSVVTWTVDSEVPTLVALPGSMNPGDGDCASLSQQLAHHIISGYCQHATLITDVLPAGTHWFVIGPWLSDQPCEQPYVATVTWEAAPTGACCIHDGSCMPDMLEDECLNLEGHFQGVGTTCNDASCESFYCSASGMCGVYISQMQIADIDHISDCESYAYYADVTTELAVESNYDISVTVPMPTGATESCSVWIDWNQDRIFNDSGELIELIGPWDQPETVFTGNVTVPSDALPGATRLRVRLQWGQDRLPCAEHWSSGEVEDYIVVVAPTVCGDLDGDEDVDFQDYAIFRSAFGGAVDADPPQDYLCDYNDDGVIGMADYAAWVQCYKDYDGGNP